MKWAILKLLLNIILIPIFVLVSIKITAPAPITEGIVENVPKFYVLGVKGRELKKLNLKDAIANNEQYIFRLDTNSIALDLGDVHYIDVIESTDDYQVIQFNYQNTYSSSSLYRVQNNKIKPLEYRLHHSVGHMPFYFIAFVLAVICSSLIIKVLKSKTEIS